MRNALQTSELVALTLLDFNPLTGKADSVRLGRIIERCFVGARLLFSDGSTGVFGTKDIGIEYFSSRTTAVKGGYNSVFELLQTYLRFSQGTPKEFCEEYKMLFREEFPI